MSDKLSPGDEFNTSARCWNDIIDAKDDYLRRKKEKPVQVALPTPTDVIKVKNVTGASVEAGHVLELGDCVLDEVKRTSIYFEADTVSHTGGRSYAILGRPMVDDAIGPAHVSGVCIAQVDIIATTDRYAYVKPSATILTSGKAGQFKILGPVDATGEQTVAVSFSDDGRKERLGKADADIALDDLGTVSLWEYDGSSWADTGIDIEAHALVAAVPGGDDTLWCSLLWADGEWVAFPQCPE